MGSETPSETRGVHAGRRSGIGGGPALREPNLVSQNQMPG
jgi:hypothetical protein